MWEERSCLLQAGIKAGMLACVGLFAFAQHRLFAAPQAWIAAFCALLLFIGFVGEESGWGAVGDVPVGYFALLIGLVITAVFTIAETSWLAIGTSIGAVFLMAILRGLEEDALEWSAKRHGRGPFGQYPGPPGADRSEDA